MGCTHLAISPECPIFLIFKFSYILFKIINEIAESIKIEGGKHSSKILEFQNES